MVSAGSLYHASGSESRSPAFGLAWSAFCARRVGCLRVTRSKNIFCCFLAVLSRNFREAPVQHRFRLEARKA